MTEAKPRLGRPPGKDYPVARLMLLTEVDQVWLAGLAEAWQCSRTEVVRRLIRAEVKRWKARVARARRKALKEDG